MFSRFCCLRILEMARRSFNLSIFQHRSAVPGSSTAVTTLNELATHIIIMPKFMNFLMQEADPRCSKLKLIQRCPRCLLLLKDSINLHHSKYAQLTALVHLLTAISKAVNAPALPPSSSFRPYRGLSSSFGFASLLLTLIFSL